MSTTWTVDCGACGITYEQSERGGRFHGNGPAVCGACGSGLIRVVQHVLVFDRRPDVFQRFATVSRGEAATTEGSAS